MYEREYDDLEPGDFEADEPADDDSAYYQFYEEPDNYVDDSDESNYNPPVRSVSRRTRSPPSLDTTDPVDPEGPEVADSPSSRIKIPLRSDTRPPDSRSQAEPSSRIKIPSKESLFRRIRRWLFDTKKR